MEDFNCNHNKLTSLAGAPSSVGGDFSCYRNKLTSLAGAPSSVGKDFWCMGNAIKFPKQQKAIADLAKRIVDI